MIILILGLTLFIGLHLTRELGVRPALVARLGSEGAYKGVYSLLALIGLVLIVWGKSAAPFTMLWAPKFELKFISHILMIPATIMLIAGNLPRSYIQHFLHNPMLGGIALWGIAHLWSNGDLASVLLFGAFTVWASFKFVSLSAQNKGKEVKKPYPFWDIIAIVVGLIGYILISRYHGQLFGVALGYI